jgi:cation transport ATPase
MDAKVDQTVNCRNPTYGLQHPGAIRGERWQVVHELAGRIRLKHPALRRRETVCRAIESELLTITGIDKCQASRWTGSLLIQYSPRKLRRDQLLEILDRSLSQIVVPEKADRSDLTLALNVASVPLAAAAQFAVPALLPVSAGLLFYTALPSLRGAYRSIVRERRLQGDFLDSIVATGCLATGAVFAGSVLCLCLGVGKALSGKSQDSSRKLLLSPFGKVPRYARLRGDRGGHDGGEIETPTNLIRRGQIIVIRAGEVIPVDGVVREGVAIIDQQPVTGEPVSSEARMGDRVFASTVLISGQLQVAVESCGTETAAARIGVYLNHAAGYPHRILRQRERFADRAVLPTLALAGVALGTVGPAGAMAVIYCDYRTGLHLAAPLALTTAIANCAHRGLLIKSGQALETLPDIDVFVFDATVLPRADWADIPDVIAGLKTRGVRQCAIIVRRADDLTPEEARSLGFDEWLVAGSTIDKAGCIARLQWAGFKVCYVGDGHDDPRVVQAANVSISLHGPESLAGDKAQIVLLNNSLPMLCELRDIAAGLNRNLSRGAMLTLMPNLACVTGAFTLGFGVFASMVMNSAAALAALLNGLAPLRRASQQQVGQEMLAELRELYRRGEEPAGQFSVIQSTCAQTAT